MSSILSLARNNFVPFESNVPISSMNRERHSRDCKAKGKQDTPLHSHTEASKPQKLSSGHTHPTVSQGKSLRPTTNKRKLNSSKSPPPPPSQITRKRRRCLPMSNSTSSLKQPEVRIKNNFPGKLFLLVQSCTSTHQQVDPILSWLVSPSHCKENDVDADADADADSDSNAPNPRTKEGLLSLVIWDKDRFLDDQLVKSSFASQSTFRSFERQLNSWQFKRDHELEAELLRDIDKINKIPTKEGLRAFFHPCFQEGKPCLLQRVKRRPPGSGNKDIKESIVQSASRTKSSSENPKSKLRRHNVSTVKSLGKPSFPENARESTPNHRPASPCDTVDSSTTNSSSSSYSNEDTEADEENHPSSIRTDIVLPSGACLRINQRIPAWAIPAQEAAIQYLYQKHSKIAEKSQSNKVCHRPSGSNSTTLPDDTANAVEASTKKVHAAEAQFAFPRQLQADSFLTSQDDALGSLLQSHRKENTVTLDVTSSDDGRFCDASEDEVSLTPPIDDTSREETDDTEEEGCLVF